MKWDEGEAWRLRGCRNGLVTPGSQTHTLSSSLSVLHVSTDNAGGRLGLFEVSSLVGVVGHNV